MMCWHCSRELDFENTTDASNFYHCAACDKWYEMRREKERVNGAVPVKFFEIENLPEA